MLKVQNWGKDKDITMILQAQYNAQSDAMLFMLNSFNLNIKKRYQLRLTHPQKPHFMQKFQSIVPFVKEVQSMKDYDHAEFDQSLCILIPKVTINTLSAKDEEGKLQFKVTLRIYKQDYA